MENILFYDAKSITDPKKHEEFFFKLQSSEYGLSFLAENPGINYKLQYRLFSRLSEIINIGLIQNINLAPDILRHLLPNYQSGLLNYYNNPETQQIRDNFLLLK